MAPKLESTTLGDEDVAVAALGVAGQVGVTVDEQKVEVAGGDAGQIAAITASPLPTVADLVVKYKGMSREEIIGDLGDRLEDIRSVASAACNRAMNAQEKASDAMSELKKFFRSV